MGRRREDDLARSLGERLRELRHARGLTQEVLAAEASIKPETVSRIETGAATPDLATLRRLLGALGARFGDVLDPPDRPLSIDEHRALEAWRALDPARRRVALDTLHAMAPAMPPEGLLAADVPDADP